MGCQIELVNDGAEAADVALIDQQALQQIIDAALSDEGPAEAGWQLTVLIVDRQRSAAVHQQLFAAPGATDVMSFPDGSINPENNRRLVGEVMICPAVAHQVVAAGPHHEQQVARELLLYILHGTLHCLGYDDIDENDRRIMWQRQQELLAPLGIYIEDHERPSAS